MVRWAIIGLGGQAHTMARAIQETRGTRLHAVIAGEKERADAFARQYGVPEAYTDLSSALATSDAIDAVCITSPNHHHVAHALTALKAGKHILCEKPLAPTYAEARKIHRAHQETSLLCGMGLQYRFSPVFQKAATLLEKGEIGTLRYGEMLWAVGGAGEKQLPPLPKHKQWREQQERSGGGALMARGVHLFDILAHITHCRVREVSAMHDAGTSKNVDQLTSGVLRLEGDVLASITTSRRIPFSRNYISLYGSDGALHMQEPFANDGTGAIESVNSRRTKRITFSKPRDHYRDEVRNFSRAIEGKEEWKGATLQDGVDTVQLAEAWKKSYAKAVKMQQ